MGKLREYLDRMDAKHLHHVKPTNIFLVSLVASVVVLAIEMAI